VTLLLDLIIPKVVDRAAIREPEVFILYCRLDESVSIRIMDEFGTIANAVNAGNAITSIEALKRIGITHLHRISFGGPTSFVVDALRA
jgi:hypothetical protein